MKSDKEFLREIGIQLEKWANESRSGGWSIHQVTPMRELASKIFSHIGRASQQSATPDCEKPVDK